MQDFDSIKKRLLSRSVWRGGCLESTYKPKSQSGYPLIKIDYSTMGVHRASWIAHNGEIPKGLWVLHSCDNPLCINPDHLFLGTPQENTNDMISKGRNNFISRRKHSDSLVDEIIERRKSGETFKKIGEKVGISISQVNGILMRPTRKDEVKDFYGVPKYDDKTRKEAFALKKRGVLCKEIQKILCIPKRSLTRILNPKKIV